MLKIYSLLAAVLLGMTAFSQVQFPKASPQGKVEQRVGVTDIKIRYSRPSKKGREVFGTVVPFDKIWRTGANENSVINVSDVLIFGKDTLPKGSYALFTKPTKTNWELYFYKDTLNWGEPQKWEDTKVALKTSVAVKALNDEVEMFTIDIQQTENNAGLLIFSWDKTRATFPFQVATNDKVLGGINKLMAGPSASDYYNAGNYYYKEKIDLNRALEWVSRAIEMQGEDAYWMLRTKSLIQADLGDYKGAIETANKGLKAAEKAKNQANIDLNKASIAEWSKKIK